MKLETKLSVPSSTGVFTFIGPHSPDFWERVSQYVTKEPQKKKKVCVCSRMRGYKLLDFELLLLLEQNLFYPWVFILFLSLVSRWGSSS